MGMMQDLGRYHIQTMTQSKVTEIIPGGLKIEQDDKSLEIKADTVVLASGSASFNPLEAIEATSLFRVLMVVGAVGTVLTAGYMLYMLRNVNFGEPADEWNDHTFEDVDTYEWLAWAPLVIGTIAIGIFPKIVFGATNDAVVALVEKAFGG